MFSRTFAATISACVAGAACMTALGNASAGALSGTLYRDPNSAVVKWVAADPGDSRTPVIRDKIASQPQAHWLSSFNLSTVTSEVSSLVGAANSAGQVPVLSAYEIPNRDCGGASAGGAGDLTQYQQWISRFAQGLGSRTVIIVLETDALALQSCLSGSEVTARDQAISQAVQTIKAANPNAKVYLDGGHSAWNSATDQGSRLKAAGVQYADGFFTNVSNFQPLANEAAYGRSIISYLESQGISGKHQVIDTSRNGGAAGDWCADDNTDRMIGKYPTLNTGDAAIDGYLWIKPPGEADGCAYTAGAFVPDLAYSLAVNAPYPSTSSTSPSPTPTSPTPTPGGCTATYQTINSWSGGFQGQITVTAGASAIKAWKITFTLPNGVTISQLWNGTLSVSGSSVTVTNASWNGSLAAGASTVIGFTANGTPYSFAPICILS